MSSGETLKERPNYSMVGGGGKMEKEEKRRGDKS